MAGRRLLLVQFGTQVTVKVEARENGDDMLNGGMKCWQLLSTQVEQQVILVI